VVHFNGFSTIDEILSTILNVSATFNERVTALIPKTNQELQTLIHNTKNEEDGYLDALTNTTIIKRGVDWIKDNGLCMEQISPGKSTLPQAGKGAFANKSFSKGELIAPAPILQIMDRDLMFIYDDKEAPIRQQILLNYCFSHKDSKLLLCPQSNIILINHCSNRKVGKGECADKGPNAKIEWASGWDLDTPLWLEMSLEQLEKLTEEKKRGLSMEVIATREIRAGEEIFIDYGRNWEEAWESHVREWKPPPKDSEFHDYTPIKEMIDKNTLRDGDELEENPYSTNVATACYWYEYEAEGYEADENGFYMADDYIPGEGGINAASDVWECDVLEEIDITDHLYDVSVNKGKLGEEVLLTQLPKESITFRTKSYKSDQWLPEAFRHYIEIDDSIFPEQWKD